MKILTVVGARPQFIKAAVVSHELSSRADMDEVIVHTGQHYDENMSSLFFEELDIPQPKINLGVSGGSHAEMTGKMMMSLEDAMKEESPDLVLLYGDTNSTLAGALCAAKLDIPICHVEAGGRMHSLSNPEEINRVCTDHVSSLACASNETDFENLISEGLSDIAVFVGDPMYDAFLKYSGMATEPVLKGLDEEEKTLPKEYVYLTCHRQENTDEEKMTELLDATNDIPWPVVYPVHPRMQGLINGIEHKKRHSNLLLVEPVGYLESIYLVNHAEKVITDSGGLQREAFFAKKKCVTLMDVVVIPATMVDNRNTLTPMKRASIVQTLKLEQRVDSSYLPFGDGRSSEKIVDEIEDFAKKNHLL